MWDRTKRMDYTVYGYAIHNQMNAEEEELMENWTIARGIHFHQKNYDGNFIQIYIPRHWQLLGDQMYLRLD
jgi:hypothetical protein